MREISLQSREIFWCRARRSFESKEPIGLPVQRPAAELWNKWLVFHHRRERMTRFQRKLEDQVLAAAGGFPVVTVVIPDREQPISVNSFAEIERLKPQLNAEQLTEARSELRRRRKQWKDTDQKLGYSAALALERDLPS